MSLFLLSTLFLVGTAAAKNIRASEVYTKEQEDEMYRTHELHRSVILSPLPEETVRTVRTLGLSPAGPRRPVTLCCSHAGGPTRLVLMGRSERGLYGNQEPQPTHSPV